MHVKEYLEVPITQTEVNGFISFVETYLGCIIAPHIIMLSSRALTSTEWKNIYIMYKLIIISFFVQMVVLIGSGR